MFLAGDAAHVHSPLGLLDPYHTERHRAGRVTLRFTDPLQRLAVMPAPLRPLRSLLAPAVMNRRPVSAAVRRTLAGLGLADHVPAGTLDTPLAGTRIPDLPLTVDGHRTRLVELLRGGRLVLVDVDGAAVAAAAPWSGRVDLVRAKGTLVGRATTLLVRPDGDLAWSSDHPAGDQVRAVLTQRPGAADLPTAELHESGTNATSHRAKERLA